MCFNSFHLLKVPAKNCPVVISAPFTTNCKWKIRPKESPTKPPWLRSVRPTPTPAAVAAEGAWLVSHASFHMPSRKRPEIWVWLKIKQEALHRFWSMFPLTRVPFWRFFEPQHATACHSHMPVSRRHGSLNRELAPGRGQRTPLYRCSTLMGFGHFFEFGSNLDVGWSWLLLTPLHQVPLLVGPMDSVSQKLKPDPTK